METKRQTSNHFPRIRHCRYNSLQSQRRFSIFFLFYIIMLSIFFCYLYFFIPDVHIPLLLQLFGHKLVINAAISGCSFANVEFNNIYVWHCTRPVSRCNWVRLWSPVICQNITNITKNIFLYPFSGKHGEKTGPRKYSMNTTNDLTVRSLMQLANVSLVKFGTTWRQIL